MFDSKDAHLISGHFFFMWPTYNDTTIEIKLTLNKNYSQSTHVTLKFVQSKYSNILIDASCGDINTNLPTDCNMMSLQVFEKRKKTIKKLYLIYTIPPYFEINPNKTFEVIYELE